MKLDQKQTEKEEQRLNLDWVDTANLVNELARRGWVLSTRTRNSKVRPVLYGPPTE